MTVIVWEAVAVSAKQILLIKSIAKSFIDDGCNSLLSRNSKSIADSLYSATIVNAFINNKLEHLLRYFKPRLFSCNKRVLSSLWVKIKYHQH